MGYALVPLVRVAGRKRGRRPFGYDQTAHNFLVLDPGDKTQASSGLCLAWLQNDIADARVIKIADVADEALSVAARTALTQRLGDRGFDGRAFNLQMANLLKTPTGLPLQPLRPRATGEYVIWLGPGGRGQNRFYTTRVVPERHSKYFADTFNRANASLNGSTMANGASTWSNPDTGWNIVSNQATGTGMPTDTFYLALSNTDGDTDSQFARAALVTFTRPSGDFLQCGVWACANALPSGYAFQVYVDDTNTPARSILAVDGDFDLAVDGVSTTSGVLMIVRDGSSVEGFVDGVSVLGPATDSSEPSGAGNRHVGFHLIYIGAAAATRTVTFDNFDGGDLQNLIHPFASAAFRQRGVFH